MIIYMVIFVFSSVYTLAVFYLGIRLGAKNSSNASFSSTDLMKSKTFNKKKNHLPGESGPVKSLNKTRRKELENKRFADEIFERAVVRDKQKL